MSETKIVNKVLNNEQRKLLAETGMLGFSENSEFIYVPKMYREKNTLDEYKIPKELWAKFKLQGKDGIEASKMEDAMGYMEWDDTNNTKRWVGKSGSHRMKILTDGIKGWSNWYDVNGEEIPFRENNNVISTHSLKRIPAKLAIELANAIVDRTSLSAEELEGLDY